MKKLVVVFFLFCLFSCQEKTFRVDQCIQKADSNMAYKILMVNEETLVAEVVDLDGKKKEIDLKEEWIETVCQKE